MNQQYECPERELIEFAWQVTKETGTRFVDTLYSLSIVAKDYTLDQLKQLYAGQPTVYARDSGRDTTQTDKFNGRMPIPPKKIIGNGRSQVQMKAPDLEKRCE